MKLKIILLLFLSWVCMAATGCSQQTSVHMNTVIAQVNGEPIEYGEYVRETGQYDLTKQSDLKEDVLDTLIRRKLEQIWAKQKGMVKEIAYHDFVQEWKEENKRRKKAVADKEVIYGPVQYDERGYFDYIHTNMVHQLKETLGKEEFQASEDQLLSLYEEIKDQYYKKSDYIKVQKVMLDHIDDDSLEEMKQVKADLDADYGWEKSVSRLSGNGILSEQIFNVNSARVDEEVNPKLYAAANRLHAGQISEVIEENQNLFLIVCLERRDEGYQSFSEVKQNLMSLWIDQKYNEKLAQLIKQADLVIQ